MSATGQKSTGAKKPVIREDGERRGRKGCRKSDERKTEDAAPSGDERRLPPGDIALPVRDLDARDEDEPVEAERDGEGKEGGIERSRRDEVARPRHQEAEGDHVRDLAEVIR
jgi:hypothetical protein